MVVEVDFGVFWVDFVLVFELKNGDVGGLIFGVVSG